MTLQRALREGDVALLDGARSEQHVRGVKILAHVPLAGLRQILLLTRKVAFMSEVCFVDLLEDEKSDEGPEAYHDQRRGRGPAARPFPDAFRRAGWAGEDRFAALPAFEIVRQRRGARVTARRLLLQTLEADGFEITIHARVQPGRP